MDRSSRSKLTHWWMRTKIPPEWSLNIFDQGLYDDLLKAPSLKFTIKELVLFWKVSLNMDTVNLYLYLHLHLIQISCLHADSKNAKHNTVIQLILWSLWINFGFKLYFINLITRFVYFIKRNQLIINVDISLKMTASNKGVKYAELGTTKTSRFRRILPQFVATMVKNLHSIEIGLCAATPIVIIAVLRGIKNDQNRDEFLLIQGSEASWIGKPNSKKYIFSSILEHGF